MAETGMEEAESDPTVGFLYKTMLQRDPCKRRVKPVQKHLIQLDFGLGDSSDDSDFELDKHHRDSDDPDSDIGDGSQRSEGSDDGSDDDDDDSDESGDEDSSEEEDGEEENEVSIAELLNTAQNKISDSKACDDTAMSTASSAKLKVRICCVCLGDRSEEEDEVVECDCCGVTVHEGCYGIGESQSVASTESSASTEPWFCDACKAGVENPSCELCPNTGGIYKETDAGKWVHIVCALYIPGVAFGDVDRLSPVTLFEMPYTKWGARDCCLCEDERFSRTGVVVACDAGMCRSYFHVTCAQREGFLSEASPEEEIADPFYAYCKQHADKGTVRSKRRNWLAIQSNNKHHKGHEILDEKEKEEDFWGHAEQLRVQRKLNRHRQKYELARAKRPLPWVPKDKMPRLLTTSPCALRGLMKKAELMGVNTQVHHSGGGKDARKKWCVPPAFSVEYVSYYLDRNVRMNNMTSHLKELVTQRDRLHEQERILRVKYDQLLSSVDKLKSSTSTLRQEGEAIWGILNQLSGTPIPMPEVLRPKRMRSPNKRDTPRSPPGIIQQCGICKKTVDQHLLAKCDTCHKHYHLGCLEPPLSRMPKKTKLMGWQCSECDNYIKEEQARKAFNPDAPRRLREKVKEPTKFTPPETASPEKKKVTRGGRRKRLQFGAKRKLEHPAEDEPIIISEDPIIINEDSEQASEAAAEIGPEEEMPILQKERPHRTSRATKGKVPEVPDVNSLCAVCHLPGEISNLVSCDRCAFLYHFHCLDPPLRKSPKKRGYAWECCACNPPTSQDSDSSEDAGEEEQVGEEVEEIHIPDDEDDDDFWVSMGTVDEETAMLDQSYSDDDDDAADLYGIKDHSVEETSGAKAYDL